jgi:hypothetical protein
VVKIITVVIITLKHVVSLSHRFPKKGKGGAEIT